MGENCPQSWTEDQLVSETEAGYEYADRRLQDCARCPATGGACHGRPSNLPFGVQPQWIDGELVLTETCSRWRDYALGVWLQAGGVPKTALGYSIKGFPDAVARGVVAALWQQWTSGEGQWAVLCGGKATGKTHLAVGLLRGCKRKSPRQTIAYCNAQQMRSALKQYFDDRDAAEHPLALFKRADFAVMDNVDPARWPQWMRDAIEEALVARWDAQMPTLVTTKTASELAKCFDGIDFDGVPQCRLTR